MFVSRLMFHTHPGKTEEVEAKLKQLEQLVSSAGGGSPRVLRSHFASDDAPDVVFEQDADDLAQLESQIGAVTANQEFQRWTQGMSDLLLRSPKREIYQVR